MQKYAKICENGYLASLPFIPTKNSMPSESTFYESWISNWVPSQKSLDPDMWLTGLAYSNASLVYCNTVLADFKTVLAYYITTLAYSITVLAQSNMKSAYSN